MRSYRLLLYKLIPILVIVLIARCYYFTNDPKELTNEFAGTVTNIEYYEDKTKLTINNQQNIYVYTDQDTYFIGDIVLVEGNFELRKDKPVFNLFDFKKYYASRKNFYTINDANITPLGKSTKLTLKLKKMLFTAIKSNPNRSYLNFVLLGNSSEISEDLYESFKVNNMLYLFTIGSMQVFFITKFFKYIKKPNLAYIVIGIYILLTNYHLALIKALMSNILNKKYYHYLNELLIALILLIIWPMYIYQPGFSFLIIIGFINKFNKHKKTRLMSIFLGSIPLIMYYNYYVNLLMPISFIFSLIYFNLVLPLVLISALFPLKIINIIISLFETTSIFIAKYFSLIINLYKPSLILMIILYILIIIIIYNLNNRNYQLSIKVFYLFIAIIIINKYIITDHVIFFDVNQGDSSLIVYKNKSYLIDTGGNYYQPDLYTKKYIVPYLKSIGIHKLDYLFITHGDLDHAGGALYLLENKYVKKTIINNNEVNELEEPLLNYENVKQASEFKITHKNLTIEGINNHNSKDENQSSLVLLVKINNQKYLFTGDITKKEELKLINNHTKNIDFFHVAHHGSKTSTDQKFINHITPKHCIISVGCNNRYNHPHQDVLTNLNACKRVYNTCEDGSVIVIIKKYIINTTRRGQYVY